jgi:PhoH-like ATPase
MISTRKRISGKRLFVLDTNVLMHDPMALLAFDEHDLFIPMVVLEELDANKKGVSEISRNVRETNRLLDTLIGDASAAEIEQGLPLARIVNVGLVNSKPMGKGRKGQLGKLYFETRPLQYNTINDIFPTQKADNTILKCGLALMKLDPNTQITLVTKDINMRIKASAVGLHAEDYFNDSVLEDADLLYTGMRELPADYFENDGADLASWQEGAYTYYRVETPEEDPWAINECLYVPDEVGFSAIVARQDGNSSVLRYPRDYRSPHHGVWGMNARNREQNFALNFLMDPDIDLVTLLGPAGTGKTLLALAAGLAQTLDDKRYGEIIMTRATIPIGEDIGFLPGTEEEKMAPWMGALMDNLEVLTQQDKNAAKWQTASTQEIIQQRIKIKSMNFMRGRTFMNKYIIIDEAQNLTSKQMKTLITRVGQGTKLVCIGNIAQIDSPYLTETTSGLTYVVDHFKGWEHSAHITLTRGERSRLADYAQKVM